MIYRIYKDSGTGYKAECQVFDIDDLFIVLDMLILDENNDKVLVIEHDVENNCDNPMYLFVGNVSSYIDFKDNYYYRENEKRRR